MKLVSQGNGIRSSTRQYGTPGFPLIRGALWLALLFYFTSDREIEKQKRKENENRFSTEK
jgi:hypothetical protein